MKASYPLRAIITLASLVLLAGVSRAEAPERTIGSFSYSTSPEVVVLELVWSGGFGGDRMGPFTRVYGDGRVHVRRSRNSKNAGDYEAWISLADLDELLRLVVSKGLMDFDPEAVKKLQREAASRKRAETGGTPMVTDASTVNLFIELYRRGEPRAGEAGRAPLKAISWRALSYVVDWYPDIVPLQNLQEIVRTMQRLAKSVEHAAQKEDTVVSVVDILGG